MWVTSPRERKSYEKTAEDKIPEILHITGGAERGKETRRKWVGEFRGK